MADVRWGRGILVDLAGSVGREQEKTRPCVVVSNDKLNRNLSTLVVVPITTHDGEDLLSFVVSNRERIPARGAPSHERR